jgi:hypothetical protein
MKGKGTFRKHEPLAARQLDALDIHEMRLAAEAVDLIARHQPPERLEQMEAILRADVRRGTRGYYMNAMNANKEAGRR